LNSSPICQSAVDCNIHLYSLSGICVVGVRYW